MGRGFSSRHRRSPAPTFRSPWNRVRELSTSHPYPGTHPYGRKAPQPARNREEPALSAKIPALCRERRVGWLSHIRVAKPGSRTARAAGDPVSSLPIAALSADRSFSPYPYPSGTRDRRSWPILRPVGYPKRLRDGDGGGPAVAVVRPDGDRVVRCRLEIVGHPRRRLDLAGR